MCHCCKKGYKVGGFNHLKLFRWQTTQTVEKLSQIDDTIDENNIHEYFKQLQEARSNDDELQQVRLSFTKIYTIYKVLRCVHLFD